MTRVPNLDNDPSIDLMDFWMRHQRGRQSRELFPAGGPGTKTATDLLAAYAANLFAAQSCRRRGDINAARAYDSICDRLYERLPDWARW